MNAKIENTRAILSTAPTKDILRCRRGYAKNHDAASVAIVRLCDQALDERMNPEKRS